MARTKSDHVATTPARDGTVETLGSGPSWDLLAAGSAIVGAALFSFIPNIVTSTLALGILMFVPGYVLLQITGDRPRLWHVFAAVGLSVPVVGLLALLTAVGPGFTTGAIVAFVTLGCLVLVGASFMMRRRAAT